MIVKLLTEHHLELLSLTVGCRGSSESTHVKCHIVGRAATFTRVNGTVSCFCNKRLQNWPTVCTWTLVCDQRRDLYIVFPNEKYSLKQWYVTSRSESSIRLFVFSYSAVFDKVSTAIRNYGGHAQRAIKNVRRMWKFFVYFLSACVLMRTWLFTVMSCVGYD